VAQVKSGSTRLYLELVNTEAAPVIGASHPDAKDIPAGFEAGTTVKVTIHGKSAYHMVSQIGFSCSEDGLTWPVGNAQLIDMDKGLPDGAHAWWRCIRVPHQLADEGNGLYTCFFSAYDKDGEFESIGKATFRVKEAVE
jgi:hypothetical protein